MSSLNHCCLPVLSGGQSAGDLGAGLPFSFLTALAVNQLVALNKLLTFLCLFLLEEKDQHHLPVS